MTEKDTEKSIKSDKKAPAKVFDIAKPGETMAPATARPMIVTHHTLARDPMVAPAGPSTLDTAGDDELAETPAPMPRISKNRIEPLHADTAPSEESTSGEGPDESSDDANQSPDLPAQEVTGESPAEDQPDEEEIEANRKHAAQVARQAEEEAAEKRAEQIQKLIESKRYHVPIRTVAERRALHAGMIILAILLLMGIAGVIAAIDMDILDIGIELPFDLL